MPLVLGNVVPMTHDDEPPRVAETVVSVAVALSGAIPVIGGTISGLSAAVKIIYDDVRARRSALAVETMTQIADGSGGDERLGARLAQDEQLETTFVAAVEAAIRTGFEQKRRLLVRTVISAVNDAARVDEAQLMVETLAQLDVPHIRALQRLEEEYEQRKLRTDFHWGSSDVWAVEPPPIKATLVRVGAARYSSKVKVWVEASSMDEGITAYGLQILEALRAE